MDRVHDADEVASLLEKPANPVTGKARKPVDRPPGESDLVNRRAV